MTPDYLKREPITVEGAESVPWMCSGFVGSSRPPTVIERFRDRFFGYYQEEDYSIRRVIFEWCVIGASITFMILTWGLLLWLLL